MKNVLFEKYLTSIYQGTQTAIQSYDNMLPSCQDEDFKQESESQQAQFKVIARECEEIAAREKLELKDNNWMEKARLWTSCKMSTITDNSTRHMAEMFILGSTMGLVQCLKDKKDYDKVSTELDELNEKLRDLEEHVLERLKSYI